MEKINFWCLTCSTPSALCGLIKLIGPGDFSPNSGVISGVKDRDVVLQLKNIPLTFYCVTWKILQTLTVVNITSVKAILFILLFQQIHSALVALYPPAKPQLPPVDLLRELSFKGNSLLVSFIPVPTLPSPTFFSLSFCPCDNWSSEQHLAAALNSPCIAHRHGQWMQHCPSGSKPALGPTPPSSVTVRQMGDDWALPPLRLHDNGPVDRQTLPHTHAAWSFLICCSISCQPATCKDVLNKAPNLVTRAIRAKLFKGRNQSDILTQGFHHTGRPVRILPALIQTSGVQGTVSQHTRKQKEEAWKCN